MQFVPFPLLDGSISIPKLRKCDEPNKTYPIPPARPQVMVTPKKELELKELTHLI